MSTFTYRTRSRWLDWTPEAHIYTDSPEREPTKPTEPDCIFSTFPEGEPTKPTEPDATHADEADQAKLERAFAVVNKAGVRLMRLTGAVSIGLWTDLDRPELRAALRTLGLDRLPVLYLDGHGVPMQYKLRRVSGQPVPISVLREMERHPAEPWKVRDRMLREMRWESNGKPWAGWAARPRR